MFHIVLVMLLVNRECQLYRTPPEEHVQILIDQRQSFLPFPVRAGEVGGSLDTTLDRLADYLERTKDLKDSVLSAMIYPIMLMLLAGGSLVLLLVYVIPQFTPIFEELGGDLPFITKMVLVST